MPTILNQQQQAAILFWPEIADIPILPADTRRKRISLKSWPEINFSKIDFRANLRNGVYDNGIAIRLGKTISGKYYSIALDYDGWDAVEVWFGTWENVVTFSRETLIEWHLDKSKIHVIFLSDFPLLNKKIHIKDAFLEIRCERNTLFCSPSIHKEGNTYVPLGTRQITRLNEQQLLKLKSRIDSICNGYMSDGDKDTYDKWLDMPTTILGENQGRHDATLFKAIRYFRKIDGEWLNLIDTQRLDRAWEWHLEHCKPPRSREEFDRICDWVKNTFGAKRNELLKRISSRSENCVTGNNRIEYPARPQVKDYIDELIHEYHFRTILDNDETWFYDKQKGIFVPHAEPKIKSLLQSKFGRTLTITRTNEYIAQIKRSTYADRNMFDPDTSWLATENCMINLKTGKVQPFSFNFKCTIEIPVKYDFGYPTGTVADFFRLVEDRRGRIIKFLYEIMYAEDVDLFLDYLAYCLWREYKFALLMIFHGAGLNGKSLLLSVIDRFLGTDNVSGESLDRLLNNPFATANLYQKLANLDADVSATSIFKNTGLLKKLTGNDSLMGEYKYRRAFKFRNHAKIIISCNKIPKTDDMSDAFFRRIMIINFTQQFFGEKDDPHLIDKLTTEEEFSILLHELLLRLPRILENGIRKTTSESMTATYEKYSMGSDPVKYFLQKALRQDVGTTVPKTEVYEHYKKFFFTHGLAVESDQSLSRKLSESFHLKTDRIRLNGERVYCWKDVKLIDWTKSDEQQSTLEEVNNLSNAQREALK